MILGRGGDGRTLAIVSKAGGQGPGSLEGKKQDKCIPGYRNLGYDSGFVT